MMLRIALLPIVLTVVLAGCSTGTDSGGSAIPATSIPTAAESDPTQDQRYPDVLGAELTAQSGDTYTIAVTISSPYDSPDQYADGWRVLTPQDAELGSHTLGHDHASEQPFTRTQSGLRIPSDVSEVVIEGRDTQNGYGGETVRVQVPSR